MLSLFTRIKNLIYTKIINRIIVNKRNEYTLLQNSQQMFVNNSWSGSESEADAEAGSGSGSVTGKISENNTIIQERKLFNTVIPKDALDNDYELQELIRALTNSNINVDNVVLHKKYEDKISKIDPTLVNSDIIIFKTKLRLLYVIIANNLYRSMFEEKKLYKSEKTKYVSGVFRYNDYIIRIDDSPYCFLDEQQIITTLEEYNKANDNNNSYEHIVIPYFTYINMKKNANGTICDCDHDPCGCKYVGDGNEGGDHNGDDDDDATIATDYDTNYSRVFYNRLRYNNISFSIQPYIKYTESLHTWATDNIKDNVNINFSKTKFVFFTHLFYKCALLLQKIHSAGLVHGDIKPDNILIKEESGFNINDPVKCRYFTVYLIDFGLAGKDNIGIGTGGTIPYCHPEFRNIRDSKRTDKYNWSVVKKKHDVWSLGLAFITLYVHQRFYNYYYKYPSYFFNLSGYVSMLVLDSIANQQLSHLFKDMLSYNSNSIDDVCEKLRVLL